MSSADYLKFIDPDKSMFFATVKTKVDQYFKENHISKQANGFMVFKTLFFWGGVLLFYGLILTQSFTLFTMLLFAMVLGFFKACVGFNVSHDSLHGAYSKKLWLNNLMGYSFNVLGGNKSVWQVSHNIVHHTYTNIEGHDEDLIVAPGLVRLTPGGKKTKIQRFQHIYAFLLYGLASISWVLRKDYVKMFQGKIGQYTTDHYTMRDYFELFFFKSLYYVIFIVIPLIVLDITWWQFLIGFIAMHFAFGLTLGLVFQLAHVVEDTSFPEPNNEGNIEEAWAVHQMRTTANFGVNSFLTTFICGGLNFQVEHHLFPKICHVHYPAISKIVKETAIAMHVPYICNDSFGTALQSHYRMLKKFSR